MDLLRRRGELRISELSASMGVTATAVRQRLDRLMEAGYVQRHTQVAGRGRPSHAYELTEEGRRQTGSNFADLAIALWEEVRLIKDPQIRQGLLKRVSSRLASFYTDRIQGDSVAEQTLRLLRKLEGQYPQMPQIANMLNLSPRTYRRRLDDEHRSFQQLLDQVRSEHATRYLQNTRLPLSSIAYMVGFSDASNFRRAYIKWTGVSPREVRNG